MATNIRLMITLPSANTTYTLAARLAAAGFAGLPAFRTLSYFTPGSDYATPNTENVTVGGASLASVEDGLIIPPGVRWDDPPLAGSQSYYHPSEIGLRSAGTNQRVLVMGIVIG